MAFASVKPEPLALGETSAVVVDAVGAIEGLFLRRAALVAEVAEVDAALARLFERIGADQPRPVPSLVLPLLMAEGVSARVAPPAGSCAYDVLCGVTRGLQTPRELRAVFPQWNAERVKRALAALIDLGWLEVSGRTNKLRYRLRLRAEEARVA